MAALPHTPFEIPRRALAHLFRHWKTVLLAGLASLVLVDAAYLFALWPDWDSIASGAIPKSQFIRDYESQRRRRPALPPLRWQPRPLGEMPEHVPHTFILAEDGGFFLHGGVDIEAVGDAVGRNLEQGKLAAGGSTISQQTVKNLFLSPSKSPLRKWHELILTWRLESNLEKKRILAIYLNVVELGRGVYGVDAAARHYWDIGVAQLTPHQTAELAAALPSPILHNPRTRTATFARRVRKISALTERFPRRRGF